MTRLQKSILWIVTLVAALSGLAKAGLHYFLENQDPFSAYRHPLEPWCLRVHVLSVPVLLFVLGWIFESHVLDGWRRRRRRRLSGLVLLGLVVLLTASGYSLQLVADSQLLAVLHAVSGLLFVAFFLVHVFPRTRGATALQEPGARNASTAARRRTLVSR